MTTSRTDFNDATFPHAAADSAPIDTPDAAASAANREHRRMARRRAGARVGFLIHLSVYIVVNLALVAIDLIASPQVRWAHYPLLGWGLGVAIHGLVVYSLPFIHTLHARLIDRELKRMQR